MDFVIEKTLAVLSERGNSEKRLALVSWNGRPAKLDLRTWYLDNNENEQQPGKGITFSDDEAETLMEALTAYLNGGSI